MAGIVSTARKSVAAVAKVGSRHPVLFGCVISAVKTGSSDYVAQMYVEKREKLDRRRNAIFITWGLLYLGGVQYFIYVNLFARRLFPGSAAFAAKPVSEKLADKAGQKAVLQQVFLDQFVHHPFVLFPAFYQVKEFIEGGTPHDALMKCWTNWGEDLRVCWATWIPVFLFNFSFCPLWMRVPVVAAVSFGFTAVLSAMRGAPQELPGAEVAGEARPRQQR